MDARARTSVSSGVYDWKEETVMSGQECNKNISYRSQRHGVDEIVHDWCDHHILSARPGSDH